MVSFVKRILTKGELPEGLAEALVVLISKMDKPSYISQFCPISLCNVLFKLITKTIVNRLKQIMTNIVSPNQCSFVPVCHITDNVIVCQELVHLVRNKHGRKGSMNIKVDLKKAHYRLKKGFILETLNDVGLSKLIMEKIYKCITSGSFKLLWNGGVTDEVRPSREVRQEDPISPYIFVICLE